MEANKRSFDDVLQGAIDLGYAEAEPSVWMLTDGTPPISWPSLQQLLAVRTRHGET